MFFADQHGWLVHRLARDDRSEAWRAACAFFEEKASPRRVRLLLDVDREQALDFLLDQAVRHPERCEAIGIALDRHGEGADLDVALQALAGHSDAHHRRAAIRLLGWRTDGSMSDLLEAASRHFTTQSEALEASWRRRHAARAVAVLNGIETSAIAEQWRRLRAFSACCDPEREASADGISVYWRADSPKLDPLLSRRLWKPLQRPKR
ncbi:MAG: hypothetical protein R3F60_31250 [bacterium]